MNQLQRNSSFELLRLIAQYFIVVYHIFLFWFYIEGPNPLPIFKAIWIPLHIGVILFVLISGYFGIKFSIKGLLRIIVPMFVYGLGLYVLSHLVYGNELKLSKLFFVSNTAYWFMRDYLFLFLLAPLVNKVIKNMSFVVRWMAILIMGWISCWVGLMGFDHALFEGYNVGHFVFLYLLGNTLFVYKEKLRNIPTRCVLMGYLLINAISAGGGVLPVNKRRPKASLFQCLFRLQQSGVNRQCCNVVHSFYAYDYSK